MSKDSYIRIRVYENEKKDWSEFARKNKFPSLSQFIRYVVSEYIEKGLNRGVNDVNKVNKNIELEQTNKLIEAIKDERKEYMEKVNDILLEMKKSKEISVKFSIKGQLLKLLGKHRYRSEELSEIFNIPEPEILAALNEMIDQKIIDMDDNVKYGVIDDGDNK